MIKQTIEYTDYDGVKRKEDFYFNLNKIEVAELEASREGGVVRMIEKIVAEDDKAKIIEMLKEFILKAYGIKSPDGRQFIKSKELSEGFSHTEAYVELFYLIGNNAEAAAKFVNGVVPKVDAPVPQN